MTSLKNRKVDKTTIVLVVLILLLFCHGMRGWYQQYHQQKMQEAELANEVFRQSQERIFVNCMISGGKEARTGEPVIWFGTEDKGVFRAVGTKVENFGVESGLIADCIYALAIDQQGRLWAGTLNQGVCVYNGESWKNYDVVDGPIGERIFDIQVCPTDGDVWMATSAGITRYSPQTDAWQHYTREDGLLEDQASSLAFDAQGHLIVGTQCHGLAFFNRDSKGQYRLTKNVSAPFRFGPDNCSPVPLTPRGEGLPSDLVNQVLVAQDGTIYVATNAGLVWSNDAGRSWRYLRGMDYADKVRGLYGGAPEGWEPIASQEMESLLPEDHVTCLAEDPVTGLILFGTRLKGLGVFDPAQELYVADLNSHWQSKDRFIRNIVPLPDNRVAFGCYLGGYATIDPRKQLKSLTSHNNKSNVPAFNQVAVKNFAPHPGTIKPPTMDELKAMQAKLESLNEPLPDVYATYYGEDWKTQGDWVGRAFRDWAVMCAVVAPFDHPIYNSTQYYNVHDFIGPNYEGNDVIRRWIHWMRSEDKRVLWNPYFGYRRQAEWDDHGEAYPLTKDGPDLWYLLEIRHEGVFKIGMYFMNKDGQDGMNRTRDYTIEIFPSPKMWTSFNEWREFSTLAEEQVRQMKPLAKGRLVDFWGGVHKYFTVSGPGIYFVKIDRNYAFNTIVSSVTIDRLQGEPTWSEQWGIPVIHPIEYNPPDFPASFENPEPRRIRLVWDAVENSYDKLGGMNLNRKYRIAAYIAATHCVDLGEAEKQLAYCLKWRLNQWDEEQRVEWKDTVQRAWQHFYDTNEGLRRSIESHKNGFSLELQNRFVE